MVWGDRSVLLFDYFYNLFHVRSKLIFLNVSCVFQWELRLTLSKPQGDLHFKTFVCLYYDNYTFNDAELWAEEPLTRVSHLTTVQWSASGSHQVHEERHPLLASDKRLPFREPTGIAVQLTGTGEFQELDMVRERLINTLTESTMGLCVKLVRHPYPPAFFLLAHSVTFTL